MFHGRIEGRKPGFILTTTEVRKKERRRKKKEDREGREGEVGRVGVVYGCVQVSHIQHGSLT
jgi:hypothetical protein